GTGSRAGTPRSSSSQSRGWSLSCAVLLSRFGGPLSTRAVAGSLGVTRAPETGVGELNAKEPEMPERDAVWFRPVWLGFLVLISAAITIVFPCVAPFAAFGVIATLTVPRRDTVMLAAALWLANQAVGFGLLHYPWTASTLAWGGALGVAAVVGTLA